MAMHAGVRMTIASPKARSILKTWTPRQTLDASKSSKQTQQSVCSYDLAYHVFDTVQVCCKVFATKFGDEPPNACFLSGLYFANAGMVGGKGA